MLERLYNWFKLKSSDSMKEEYLKNNEYPEKDKIFIDFRGNVSIIIGKETFKNTCKVLKDFKLGKYNI